MKIAIALDVENELEGLFDNDKADPSSYKWTDASETGLNLLNFMNNTYTVQNYGISYVNKMFCNIVPIYIVSTFTGFSQVDKTYGNNLLNIYTMFNWELVKDKTMNLFCDSFVGQNTNMFSTGINVEKPLCKSSLSSLSKSIESKLSAKSPISSLSEYTQ